jgi:tetratricopeptide (TPR) repeat protein
VLGNDHTDTLASINNLATFLKEQGKLTEAEPLNREAVKGFRRFLGDDHPDTVKSIINLAVVLYDQGKLIEAELSYKQALDALRRLLGDENPGSLTIFFKPFFRVALCPRQADGGRTIA